MDFVRVLIMIHINGRGGEIREMKLLKLVLYSLGLAAAFVLFDRLLFFGLREGATRFSNAQSAKQFPWKDPVGEGEGQVLILGTSRMNAASEDDILSSVLKRKVYKEASRGKFPRYNSLFYRYYREKFGIPSLVLYGPDYFIFAKESSNRVMATLGTQNSPGMMDPAGAMNPASPWLSRVSWLFRFKPKIDEFFTDLWSSDPQMEEGGERSIRSGGGARANPKKPRQSEGFVIVEKPPRWRRRIRGYQPFPGKEGRYLEGLLEDLQSDGVPVFLVFIPDYVGSNQTNFQQEKFKSDFRRLFARYKRTWVLDYNRPEKFDLDDPRLFFNGGWGASNCHLNDLGASLFSQAIAHDIRTILETGSASHR